MSRGRKEFRICWLSGSENLKELGFLKSLSFAISSNVFILMLEARRLQQVQMLDPHKAISVGRRGTYPSFLFFNNEISSSENLLMDFSCLGQNCVTCSLLYPVWLNRFGLDQGESSTTYGYGWSQHLWSSWRSRAEARIQFLILLEGKRGR